MRALRGTIPRIPPTPRIDQGWVQRAFHLGHARATGHLVEYAAPLDCEVALLAEHRVLAVVAAALVARFPRGGARGDALVAVEFFGRAQYTSSLPADPKVMIEWSDRDIAGGVGEMAKALQALASAEAISRRERVRFWRKDWSEEQVDAEAKLIDTEVAVGEPWPVEGPSEV